MLRVNTKTLIRPTLYYSFVYPYLHYGITAWGDTYDTYLDPLFKLQKRVIRIIFSACRDAHTQPLFKELKILDLSHVYSLNVMMFMFKFNHGLLPDVFGNMFMLSSAINHERFSRHANLLYSQYYRLDIVKQGIRIQGERHWNYMLDKIDIICSPATYKFHLKRFLLNATEDLRQSIERMHPT